MFHDRLEQSLKVRGARAARNARRASPHVELLEDRLTPAHNFISDPAAYVPQPEAPVLTRLARFVPSAAPQVSDWVSVGVNDASLDPTQNGGDTNIYVVAHGWAPGFIDMVQENGTALDPLKWWETLDIALPGSPLTPASPEMFYGFAGDDGVQISPTGLAYALTQADPKAVVLAYSWIDESATDEIEKIIPENAGLSEAFTAMNGQRLANALEMALPTDFHTDNGQLHLIGHSHGSKVATVATLVLNRTAEPNFHVSQLTLLDSPEVGSLLVREVNAANNNWFFLGGVDITHVTPSATQTFLDHYISEFDSPLGDLQGFNPFDTTTTTGFLQNVVDVTLDGEIILSSLDLGDLHGYAFNWYGAGSLAWAQNPTPDVADRWSPLINVANLPSADSYTQSWTALSEPQFQLTASPNANTVTDIPQFTDVSLSDPTPSSSYNSGQITLTEDGVSTAEFTGKFSPEDSLDGISFQYQFTTPGNGDQLVISVEGEGFGYAIGYVMTGTVAGTTTGVGTLSLTTIAGAWLGRKIKFQLVPLPGSNGTGATVIISNLQQFTTRASQGVSLQDNSTEGGYSVLAGQPSGLREIAVFTDPDPSAVAADFDPLVDWGGAVVGTPTVTVVRISAGPGGSTWQVLGNVVYQDAGNFSVEVGIRDRKSGTRINAGEQKTFAVSVDADTRFVQALYLNVLGRAGSAAEVSGWVGLMSAGATTTQIADAIERSTEALTVLVGRWYEQYLGRPADSLASAWVQQLENANNGNRDSVLVSFLSGSEFYDRAQTQIATGEPDERYIQFLYQSLLGRTAGSAEVAGWVSALSTVGPYWVVSGFLTSAEWRAKTIDAYYTTLLHRPADAAGAAGFLSLWNSTGVDAASIRLLFEGSAEFYLNG